MADQRSFPGFGKRTAICPECGETFECDKADRQFCSDDHKSAFHNRSSKIGRAMVPLAMAWRLGRNAKGKSAKARALRASAARAFAEMCRLIDGANSEDRAIGRPSKLQFIRARNARLGTLRAVETAKHHEQADAAEAARLAPKVEAAPAPEPAVVAEAVVAEAAPAIEPGPAPLDPRDLADDRLAALIQTHPDLATVDALRAERERRAVLAA